jgi:hypothetical protein
VYSVVIVIARQPLWVRRKRTMPTQADHPAFINRLLDNIKERMQYPTDAALAAHLGVSRQMLHKVRRGEKRAPWKLLSRALDHAGYAVSRDSLLSLLPKEFGEGIRKFDNERIVKRAQLAADQRYAAVFQAIDKALEVEGCPPEELLDAIEYHFSKRT